MKEKKQNLKEKQPYVEPRVLATYKKKDLKEMIKPHGDSPIAGGCGCGCGIVLGVEE